ncbi:MAG: hypothetical protein QXD23_03430 [Candidatus Micrarchaeaceae archaeon]
MTTLNEKLLVGTATKSFTNYFTPQIGENIIRILPLDPPIASYFEHFSRWSFNCKRPNARCPICLIADRFNLPDLKAYQRYVMYVWDLKDKDHPVKLYPFGSKIAQSINLIVSQGAELMDPVNGISLVISRSGTGLKTQYTVLPSKSIPLPKSIDLDQIESLTDFLKKKSEDDDESLLPFLGSLQVSYDYQIQIIEFLAEQGFLTEDQAKAFINPNAARSQDQTQDQVQAPLVNNSASEDSVDSILESLKRGR